MNPGPSGQPSVAAGPLPSTSKTSNEYAALPERYVFVPRDRKCSKFSGRSSLNIEET